MINIILSQNKSEEIVFDKELIEAGKELATLKQDTSIINPVFLLKLDKLPNFNYVSCEEMGRKYFVRSITSVNGLWEIGCECDVLSTYKNQIRENKAVIKRQENAWNLFYNDGSFRTYQNPHIITRAFPSGFNPSTPTFVLAVAGGAEDIPA